MNTSLNATKSPYKAYIYAITEQFQQHIAALDELHAVLLTRALNFTERNSIERSLQVLAEIAIGSSRHFLKSRQKPVPSESRAVIERTYEQLTVNHPPIEDMRGAIGMRNAIIHDYLNLDWQYIEKIMRQKKYHLLADYIKQLLDQLKQVAAT